jgi:hypothetical protein
LRISLSQDGTDKSSVPLVKPPLGLPKEGVLRPGRGFSYGEVEKAGASVDDMKVAHLRVDHLRKSVYEENVKTIQELLGTRGRLKSVKGAKAKEKVGASKTKKQGAKKKGKAKGASGKK